MLNQLSFSIPAHLILLADVLWSLRAQIHCHLYLDDDSEKIMRSSVELVEFSLKLTR